MAETWAPRPSAAYAELEQGGYQAGYSDGYHGYGPDAPDGTPHVLPAYLQGYEHGRADSPRTIRMREGKPLRSRASFYRANGAR